MLASAFRSNSFWGFCFGALVVVTVLTLAACSDDASTTVEPDADLGPDGVADAGLDVEADVETDGPVVDVADIEPGDVVPDGPPDLPPLDWQPFVRGTFNAWEATDALNYVGDGIYAGSVLVSEGPHEFKVADAVWSLDTIYSANATDQIEIGLDTDVPLVIATGFNNNTEITIPEEAEYTFAVTVTLEGGGDAGEPVPSLSLFVTQGSVVDPGDLPPDDEVFQFEVTTPGSVTLEGGSGMLGPQELFDALAIVIPAGETVQYVYGDNLDGYLEGWTQAYSSATRYWHRTGYLLSYFASLVADDLNDLEIETTETEILPYGVRNHYGVGVWDEIVLHAGRRAVSIRVHSDTPARLALIPKLNLRRSSSTFARSGDVMVWALDESLRREGSPGFMAAAADRDWNVTGADLDAMPFLTDRANIRITDQKPLFSTNADETDFRVVLAFAETAEEAAAEALALSGVDAVGEHQQATYDLLTSSYLWTDDPTYSRALMWAKLSAFGMVNEQFGTGIWAGLPWFKDNWGRDTFIALPGTLLVNGLFDEARAVIREFANLQNVDTEDVDFGRIPNRVASLDDIIYNTTDGTPWMVREILETVRYTGDTAFATEMYPVIERYIEGAIDNYVDDEGFLSHDDADTWMDARFGPLAEYPWSARGDRAVEIQVLWYEALRYGAELAADAGDTANATAWTALADDLRGNFLTRFWDADSSAMADRVRADDSRDLKVRPNQLMLVSIPFEDRLVIDGIEAWVVRNAVGTLLFPYGIASLSQDHDYFHPHHDNQPTFNKDAAYHNGTVWLWNAGPTVTALTRFGYTDHAYALSANMAAQLLELGTRGSLSELLDAHPDESGDVILSGTFSQTWSVSEYARNGYQDYVGFRPDLRDDRLALWPAIPSDWDAFDAQLAFGDGGRLLVDFERGDGGELSFTVQTAGTDDTLTLDLVALASGRSRHRVSLSLAPATSHAVVFDPSDSSATIDGGAAVVADALGSQQGLIGVLELVEPDVDGTFSTMQNEDYLQGIIEGGTFE